MDEVNSAVRPWLAQARAKLAAGTALQADDLDALEQGLAAPMRQHLIYLYTADPNPRSGVLAWVEFPATTGPGPAIATDGRPCPYNTIIEAILDGWQVVHFPDHRAPFDDREIDILGYQFVLQKLQVSA
jgi:hypothetical protein